MEDVQPARGEDGRHPDLAPDGHLQPPDHKDGDAQHGDIGEQVEDRGRDVELVDIDAAPGLFHIPDLAARMALRGGDDEESGVEGGVGEHEEGGEPICDIAVDGAEDALDEQHNGELGGEQRKAVHHVAIIVILMVVRWFGQDMEDESTLVWYW